MTSCILTIIKNEHEYLDEWIQYHLNIGIDKIFIFEDLDSESHKSICDKYDKVYLNRIENIINRISKDKAYSYKKKHSIKTHSFLLYKCMLCIKKYSNEYDWCFAIDIDEFITFENNNINLQYVLNLYKDYDAFIMSWKLYGANGLINKPDYTHEGVLNIYTKPSDLKIKNSIKQCFNLKKYNNSFFDNAHYPSDNCNWCNTIFKKDHNTQIFEKIYLRHYITKSLEEYIWKKKSRGYFYGQNRNIDFFFQINSDMNNEYYF